MRVCSCSGCLSFAMRYSVGVERCARKLVAHVNFLIYFGFRRRQLVNDNLKESQRFLSTTTCENENLIGFSLLLSILLSFGSTISTDRAIIVEPGASKLRSFDHDDTLRTASYTNRPASALTAYSSVVQRRQILGHAIRRSPGRHRKDSRRRGR
jgi:hypothetical protein